MHLISAQRARCVREAQHELDGHKHFPASWAVWIRNAIASHSVASGLQHPDAGARGRREVRAYYSDKGAFGPVTDAVGAVVCTYEKANGLVNRLLEEESLGDLSCIVVDELHMVRRCMRVL